MAIVRNRTGLKDFALAVYRNEEVPPACLNLQDRHGIDVNLLLFASYVGASAGASLSIDDAAKAHELVAQWHREVVVPLRVVRRRLKTGPAPAPDDSTAALRKKVAAAELEAEIIELDQLDQLAVVPATEPAKGDPVHRAGAALETIMREMTGREPDDEDRSAITTIATAAARVASGR